jgi:tyrosyl-tRNA synthetase
MDFKKSDIGMSVIQIMVEAKLVKTKSEARRMIEQGAVKLGNVKIFDPTARLAYDKENRMFHILQSVKDE